MRKKSQLSSEEAAKLVKDGDTVILGGFIAPPYQTP